MTSEAKLNKWGNSLALRIPSGFLEALGLSQDSKLKLSIQDEKLIIEKQKDLKQLCKAMNKNNLNIDSVWENDTTGKEW
ncbi:AbrB/MazE/SpoVT family DNA-binding domain-containing protein [Campylobacter sp. MIT 21-1685]|uniref:AbrB/MazE/SpoVT family DNA-binding domain-containing protein n=1 Tax=unclassified Campylobacter TaxID=2593542 RepID=UPI00224B5AC5|nr:MULTISPECIES: AbrB/MazE/SpoVT family DNA-binding domain-containing protein [unclassified Campylobacter]MCX2683398.1 AbrB/MazE/SpoVT family DNA-binding domain-containing protein [Campylobacter sp. MIT 21-1684]MCX2751675.1 AbrB/MazE/SpoVT family DNA-binding domain-containing protein [Campylobacter sp. MIT 21-1682]MCX2807876.1 AbrB/MazE/SpoVT family DNA-binding domain-containing protein [Campylobacter sp. MIT 21-1685]